MSDCTHIVQVLEREAGARTHGEENEVRALMRETMERTKMKPGLKTALERP